MKGIIAIIALLCVAATGCQTDVISDSKKDDLAHQKSVLDKIKNIGTTKTLEILPLIDWYTARNDLKSEAGVSYLIKTDQAVILFDVGFNEKREDPSPLMQNMNKLGVDLKNIDVVIISHNHVDHVGGFKWSKDKTFSMSNAQTDLTGKRVYTPVPMAYPGLEPVFSDNPVIISKGVSTTGTIFRYIYFTGLTPEQSLAVNVEDKGIVLIVGCGHQTLSKLIARAQELFDEPIYGIVGGLHYPVTESRLKIFGFVPIQKIYGTGKPPWSFITMEDVSENIEELKKVNPGIVALSPHDSCDVSIAAFKKAFPSAFCDIRVGKSIIIGKARNISKRLQF